MLPGPPDASCTCCSGVGAFSTATHSAISCISGTFSSLGEALDAGDFVQVKVGCAQVALKYPSHNIARLPVTYAVFDSANGLEVGVAISDDSSTKLGGCIGSAHVAGVITVITRCPDAGWCDVLADGGYAGCL